MWRKSLLSLVPQNKPLSVISAKEQPFCETCEMQCIHVSTSRYFWSITDFLIVFTLSWITYAVYCYFVWPLWLGAKLRLLPSQAKHDKFFQSKLHFWVWQCLCLDFTCFLKQTLWVIPCNICIRYAEYTALLGCPDASVEVLYPVLWSSTPFCPPQALVLSAAPALLLQLQSSALVLEASSAAPLSLSASEAPSCLQDNSEVKQSCDWCGKSVSLWGMGLHWGEQRLTRDPAPLWKLRPW